MSPLGPVVIPVEFWGGPHDGEVMHWGGPASDLILEFVDMIPGSQNGITGRSWYSVYRLETRDVGPDKQYRYRYAGMRDHG